MTVEVVSVTPGASGVARRNAAALGAAIERWSERFRINHEVDLFVVESHDADETFGGIQIKDDAGYYSAIYVAAPGIASLDPAEIDSEGARTALNALLMSLTAPRDPALGIATDDLIDVASRLIVDGFIIR